MNRRMILSACLAVVGTATLAGHAQAMYHQTLGRFLNRDPIEYRGGDENLYRYVGNDPVNAVDPTGKKPGNPLGPLVGYGKYCGLTRAASCDAVDKPSIFNSPIDDIDRACMEHDCCLATWRQYFNPCRQLTCNFTLCEAVKKATCLTWLTSVEIANCEFERIAIMAAYCKPSAILTPGDGNVPGPWPH